MKTKNYQTLSLKACLSIPRFNYRNLSPDDAELKAFADRLSQEGQLTPVRIAKFTPEALADKTLQKLCKKGDQLLLDGERRLIALSMVKDIKSVAIEYFTLDSLKDFLALQMTFNMDRKNTSFTEDGFGFRRFLDNGGSKADLLKCISFPADILTKKARLKYISERTDLIDLHISLHPFLDSGLIRSYKSKPHQGYLIKGFSELHQIALAEEYSGFPQHKSDDAILGFFNKFRTRFDNPPFDPEDESLGIAEFGTKACTACPHLKTIEEEDWDGTKEEKTYCYLADCFEAKTEVQVLRLKEKLAKDQTPFVLLGQAERNWCSSPAEEELPDGMLKIRYYKLVEPGSCSHAIAGLADYDAGNIPKGQIHYACPEKSGCIIHHPQKKEKQQQNRKLRLSTEKMKLEKATRISTAIDWATQLLSADFSAIKEELLSEYLICSFEYFFRASDSETQATFKNLIQEKEQKSFKAWTSNAIRASFSEYGMEKSCFALLLAHLIHDYTPAWDRFEDWGNKTKIDFAAMLQSKLSQNLETLNQKQEKRKLGWTKEQELQEKKVHALYFDLPLFLGICWEKEDELLELLHDEAFGKRVCRLIGVKLPKDLEYVPAQILEKLKGRKAELETIFPKYKLPKKEADLLKVFQAIPDRALPDLIPEAIQFRTGPIYDFLKKCIQKASSESNIALAEFLTASVRKEKLSLPLLHRDTVQIINKIIKKEALTGYVELDKKAKAVCFIQQNLAIQKE